MSQDILYNHHNNLSNFVNGSLSQGVISAHFVVGYLFFDGLVPLRHRIATLPLIEILIGNVVNRFSEEVVRAATEAKMRGGEDWVKDQEDVAATLRELHDRAAAESAVNIRRTIDDLPRNKETQSLLITFAERIAEGSLKIRLYTHGRIHSKATIIQYGNNNGIAIVGASNMTMKGPGHPTELNVVVREQESVQTVSDWFKGLWDVSQDFHRELFDELGKCWALS